MRSLDRPEIITCNFCNKNSDKLEFLIVSADEKSFICNECIRSCEAIAYERKVSDIGFMKFPGELHSKPMDKLRPITQMPKTWYICDKDLFSSNPNVTACSPDGKKKQLFSLPKQLVRWIISPNNQIDIEKIRDEIKSDIQATIREVMRNY